MRIERSKENYCMGRMGKRLVIQLTNACNGHCFFCVGGCNKPHRMAETKDIIKIANDMTDYEHVLILGGEAALYPDRVIELVKGLQNKKITINTNGTNLSRFICISNLLDKVIVSIMHYDMNENKRIVGVIPELDAVKEMAKTNPKLKLRVNCVMHNSGINSFEDMEKMCRFAKEKGFTSVKFSEMSTEKNPDKEFLDIQELLKDKVYDLHTDDPLVYGCYIEPKSLETLFGIKVIINLTCHLKTPIKRELEDKDKAYCPMKNVDSIYIAPDGKVTTSFDSFEDKALDRSAC